MSIDSTDLLKMAAELSEEVEAEFPNCHLGTFAIVLEIGDEEENWTLIRYSCNDARRWVQAGFFAAAKEAVEHTHARLDPEGDDE